VFELCDDIIGCNSDSENLMAPWLSILLIVKIVLDHGRRYR